MKDPEREPFNAFERMMKRLDAELYKKTEDELEENWHFRWEDSARLEWNAHQFYVALNLYRSFCRRWEGMHNGSVHLAERVRDKYLMPKIKLFIKELTHAALGPETTPQAISNCERGKIVGQERIMREWDYWRERIANGDKSSAPRDWFESVLEEIGGDGKGRCI